MSSAMTLQATAKAANDLPDGARVADYWALLKPRVMSLVVFTALTGLVAAPGSMDLVPAVVTILCIAVGAGASGALNMWYDADIDAVMTRTQRRPIPAGAVAADEALGFGVFLSAASVLTLGLLVSWSAAAFLAFTILFYVVVYTMWLKRRTPQNIVIGGAAGAFPPAIAWMAAGGPVGWEAFVLFAIIFVWTPPHFWALGLFRSGDYARAGVPMLPVVKGAAETKRQILAYAIPLAPLGVLPVVLGFGGIAYGLVSAVLGGVFVVLAVRLRQTADGGFHEDREAKRLFGFSILYLFALYAVLLVEKRHARGRTADRRALVNGAERDEAGVVLTPEQQRRPPQPIRRARPRALRLRRPFLRRHGPQARREPAAWERRMSFAAGLAPRSGLRRARPRHGRRCLRGGAAL